MSERMERASEDEKVAKRQEVRRSKKTDNLRSEVLSDVAGLGFVIHQGVLHFDPTE